MLLYRLYIDCLGDQGYGKYRKMYAVLCTAIDEVIDPLEKIPLAAPQARKLREALREAEDIYIKTTVYFEETEDAQIVRLKTDVPL